MSDHFRMFKKVLFSPARPGRVRIRPFPWRGRSEREAEAYFFAYVEALSDARTKLEAFFNIHKEVQGHGG
jgi:hypothetical protein